MSQLLYFNHRSLAHIAPCPYQQRPYMARPSAYQGPAHLLTSAFPPPSLINRAKVAPASLESTGCWSTLYPGIINSTGDTSALSLIKLHFYKSILHPKIINWWKAKTQPMYEINKFDSLMNGVSEKNLSITNRIRTTLLSCMLNPCTLIHLHREYSQS